jgi:hypothetical protein
MSEVRKQRNEKRRKDVVKSDVWNTGILNQSLNQSSESLDDQI